MATARQERYLSL